MIKQCKNCAYYFLVYEYNINACLLNQLRTKKLMGVMNGLAERNVRDMNMKIFKKYYINGTYQGIYILMLKRFTWFTDCGDWFIYIYTKRYVIRFSSAGFLIDRKKN